MEQPTPRPSSEQTKAILADRSAARAEEHEQNRQDIIAHLKERGLRPEAIAAIVGNIAVETGGSFKFDQMQTRSGDPYDPNTVRFGGYGLFQFDDYSPGQGHRSWYQEYLKDNEKTDSIESQLDYVLDTIFSDTQDTNYKYTERLGVSDAGTLKAYLKTNTDPKQISDAFVDRFEKAGIPHSSRRRDAAMKTFAELSPPDRADISPDDQFLDQPGEIRDTGEDVPEEKSTYEKIKPYVPILRHFNEGGMSTDYTDIMRNYPITEEMIEAMEDMTPEERAEFRRKIVSEAIEGMRGGEQRAEPMSKEGKDSIKKLRRYYNDGGIAKQMELFEDGGLKDEGGTTDPVSGNDVPPGSTQEEVRDDIPAQLSEGEFVFPADVVRYIGLEKLMQMRQEAKMGLKTMEDMGQMGNSDEAVMPDDIPFDLSDLDMEDDLEYNVGGFVPAPGQGFPSIPPGIPTPREQVANQQFGIAGTQQSAFAGGVGGYTPYQMPQYGQTPMAQAYTPAQQQFVPTQPVPTTLPTPEQFLPKTPTDPEVTTKEYINPETGEKRVITFVGGQPTIAIPDGFISMEEYEKTKPAETKVEEATTQTTRVADQPDPGKEDLEAARLKAEQEKYGVGGAVAKLGIKDFFGTGQDYIYGVNYLDGMGMGLLGVGQAVSGKIPDNATILLKNDNDEVLLTGAEYKIVAKEVKAPGTNYSKTRDIIDAGRVRAGEAAQQRFLESLTDDDEDDKKDDATKYSLTEKQLDDYAKSYAGVTDFSFGDSSPPPAPASKPKEDPSPPPPPPPSRERGEGSMDAARSYSMNQSSGSSFSSQALGDRTSGRVGFDEGGLASKPKPKKTKKMKRGGLASKK